MITLLSTYDYPCFAHIIVSNQRRLACAEGEFENRSIHDLDILVLTSEMTGHHQNGQAIYTPCFWKPYAFKASGNLTVICLFPENHGQWGFLLMSA